MNNCRFHITRVSLVVAAASVFTLLYCYAWKHQVVPRYWTESRIRAMILEETADLRVRNANNEMLIEDLKREVRLLEARK